MTGPLELRDPLTGVYSRTFMQVRLREETERSRRYGLSFSLLVLDLDHFKSVNDAFGHTRGDEALAECALRLQQTVRETDLVFRYGGDEFVLLLPHTAKDQALVLAQRLVDAVGKAPFGLDPPLSLSASIGLAQYPDDAQSPEALFERADRLHYEAKRAGRGRVVADETAAEPLLFDSQARPVERDKALKAAHDFLEQLPEKRRGVLLVSGPLGVGKSRFLQDVGRAAGLQGFAVLAVRGRPALRSRPYGALIEARRDWAALSSSGNRPEAYLQALAELCRERDYAGLIVLADDLADLDPATLQLFREMLLAPDLPAVALICAVEVEGYSRFEAPLQAGIRLEQFSPAAIRVWLRGLLKWEPPHHLVDWLFAQTGGLPAYLKQTLGALVEQDLLRKTDLGWDLSAGYAEAWVDERAGLRLAPPPGNLPLPHTDFVGRVEDLLRLKDLLETERLLTVVGPGGIGKTRLAVQAAAESSHRYPHGVFFVSAPAARLAPAIAEALDLRLAEPEPVEAQLLQFLRERRLLLLIDNCERLAEGLGLLAEILARAPAITVLATSLERLNLPGETVCELRGLPYPRAADGAPAGNLEDYAAVQLFLHAARRSTPSFQLDDSNRDAVQRICELTDGMPLGLELAAAWTRTLTCREIALALAGSLDLLSKSRPLPGLPASHRSVRAMLDYFWSLLSPDEQGVARRLALFRGGFQREAAAAVAGASPFFLSALVDRAFLAQPAGGRYSLHELLRQYAEERLAQEAEDMAAAARRHCAHYAGFLQAREADLKGARQRAALAELDAELENVRAAWAWAVSRGQGDPLAQGAGALALYLDIRGRYREGDAAFAQAAEVLRASEAGPGSPALGLLLAYQAMCRYNLGLYDQACELLDQSLALLRSAGDQAAIAYALYYLTTSLWGLGQYAEAGERARECLALARLSGDRWAIARATMVGGVVADSLGHYPEAMQQYRQALALFREIGDTRYISLTLYNMGDTLRLMGRPLEAQPLFKEGLAMARKVGYRAVEAYAISNLGQAALALRAAHEAGRLLRESLALAQGMGDRYLLGLNLSLLGEAVFAAGDFAAAQTYLCQALLASRGGRVAPVALKALAGLARLQARAGDLARAVELWAHVAGHPAADRADQVRVEGELEAAAADLPPEAFARARERGRAAVLPALVEEFSSALAPEEGAPPPEPVVA